MIRLLKDNKALGTVEIVIIIAILIAIALIFRQAIMGFVQDMIQKIFGDDVKNKLEISMRILW